MAYSECLPTRLDPLAEVTCFSQAAGFVYYAGHFVQSRAPATSAGLDEGLLQFSLSNLLYMENPYSYKKYQ